MQALSSDNWGSPVLLGKVPRAMVGHIFVRCGRYLGKFWENESIYGRYFGITPVFIIVLDYFGITGRYIVAISSLFRHISPLFPRYVDSLFRRF